MCAEQFVVARLAEFGEAWEHFHEHQGLVENLVLKHRGSLSLNRGAHDECSGTLWSYNGGWDR